MYTKGWSISIIVNKTLTIGVRMLLVGGCSVDFMSMSCFMLMSSRRLNLFFNADKDYFVDTDYINFYHDMQYTT